LFFPRPTLAEQPGFVPSSARGRLLGAHVVLTGVSPAVAQTLLHLETRLDGIETLGTLASGIARALRR
jgi:rsbT co-antagonist protein RsbR